MPTYDQQPNLTAIPCPQDYHYEFFTADYTTPMYRSGSVGAQQAAEDDARLMSNTMVAEIARMVDQYLKAAKCKGNCTRSLIYISNPQTVGPYVKRIPNRRHEWETEGFTASVHVTEYLIIGCHKPGAPPVKLKRPKKGTIVVD